MPDPMVNESKVEGTRPYIRRHSRMDYLTRRCRQARGHRGPQKRLHTCDLSHIGGEWACPDSPSLSPGGPT